MDDVWGIPIVQLRRPMSRSRNQLVKRCFDVVAASAMLVLTAPLLLTLGVAVRLSGPGPILFRQKRVGLDGTVFEILKFRSMHECDDSDTRWSVAGDDGVTRVGRVLRATSLDELPQLVNVLRGEMSLVGPRPERPHFADSFSATIPRYRDRHRAQAGMTGLPQVCGLRGDTWIVEDDALSARQRLHRGVESLGGLHHRAPHRQVRADGTGSVKAQPTRPTVLEDLRGALPDFLLIGAMKCGTTSLYHYLRDHPQIFMPSIKAPEFFAEEGNWGRGIGWYRRQFEGAAPGVVAIGEASNVYTKYPRYRGVPARIADHIPYARLVYVVRDPIDRIRSHYQTRLTEGTERAPIGRAVRENPIYLDYSRYAMQLDRYLDHFPREQLLVITAEDLREATGARPFGMCTPSSGCAPITFRATWTATSTRRGIARRGPRCRSGSARG